MPANQEAGNSKIKTKPKPLEKKQAEKHGDNPFGPSKAEQRTILKEDPGAINDKDKSDLKMYHNQAIAIPKSHAAQEFFQIPNGSYKTNPSPYPNRSAVIDTVRKKVEGNKISIEDAEMLKDRMIMKKQNEREQVAKFQNLKKEREYYKSYFPTVKEQKDKLNGEVDELRDQSRLIREQSRFDRDRIDRDLNQKDSVLRMKQQEMEDEMQRIRNLQQEQQQLNDSIQNEQHRYEREQEEVTMQLERERQQMMARQQQKQKQYYQQQQQSINLQQGNGRGYDQSQQMQQPAVFSRQQEQSQVMEGDLDKFLEDFNHSESGSFMGQNNIQGNQRFQQAFNKMQTQPQQGGNNGYQNQNFGGNDYYNDNEVSGFGSDIIQERFGDQAGNLHFQQPGQQYQQWSNLRNGARNHQSQASNNPLMRELRF